MLRTRVFQSDLAGSHLARAVSKAQGGAIIDEILRILGMSGMKVVAYADCLMSGIYATMAVGCKIRFGVNLTRMTDAIYHQERDT